MAQISPHLIKIFSGTNLFKQVSETNIKNIIQAGELQTLHSGATIMEKSQFKATIFIVCEGSFRVVLPAAKEEQVSGRPDYDVATLDTGESFSEFSYTDILPSVAKVIALQASQLFLIPYSHIQQMTDADHAFGKQFYLNLLKISIERARDMNQKRKHVAVWDINFCR